MKQIQITDDVAQILREATITETTLKLNGQLSRERYMAVMKVIAAAGGKWSRKDDCHIFQVSPLETFAAALSANKIEDRSEKALRTEKQAFYTPQSVANLVILHAGIKPGDRVLEPSAGAGALAIAAKDAGGIVTCVELDAEVAKALERLRVFKEVIHGDFLEERPSIPPRHNVVVMNPPFRNGQDIAHVEHALEFLTNPGVLVAIMTPTALTGSQKKHDHFRRVFAAHNGKVMEEFRNGEFKESGTSVTTMLVRMETLAL